MRPIEARFASPITLEPNSHIPSVVDRAPRLHVSDELAYHSEWNVAAAPGTTGEHHVVITPKRGLINEIRTASPELIEDVASEFLSRENAVLTYTQDARSVEKLVRFDLYNLPQNYLPVETTIRNERALQNPQALSAIRKGMRNATTAQGLWDSSELLSPEEAHKTFGSEIVGLVFAMQQKMDNNTQEKKPFTPEDVSDLIRDIDSAYNEVYEDAQESKDPNLAPTIQPSYHITVFKSGEQLIAVFHPKLKAAEAVPSSFPSHGDIFTQVHAILHQQNPPLAA